VKRHLSRQTVVVMLALAFALRAAPGLASDSQKRLAVIRIESFMFDPQLLAVAAGTTVTWTNFDEEVHTVRSDKGLFKSGGLDTGQQFSYRFDVPGTYHFTCSLHPQMIGTIIVQ
jgi:plastocyanin